VRCPPPLRGRQALASLQIIFHIVKKICDQKTTSVQMNNKVARFAVRFPVSVNSVYRAWQNRVIMCPKAKQYKQQLLRELRALELPRFGAARLDVQYIVHAPDNKRRDLANLDKLLTDTLQAAGLFKDDEQIDNHWFTRGAVDGVRPRIEVFIKARGE